MNNRELEKIIKQSKKKKFYRDESYSQMKNKTYVPWKVYPETEKSPAKEDLSFSWTAVFQVTFDSEDGYYPIIPCKIASRVPSAMNNRKFTAGVTFLKSFWLKRHVQFSISTVMTKTNMIISGIKNIWYLAEILLGLNEVFIEAHLPVPLYKEIYKIDLTAVTDVEDTILINKVIHSAEEGMEIGMKLNIKSFPTVHVAAQILPNSVLELEKQFPPKILKKNYGSNISFKISKRRISSCGLENMHLVFALHRSLFNSLYNCPVQIIVKNRIAERKTTYSEKELQEASRKERAKIAIQIEEQNLQIERRNKQFTLFFKVYFIYYKLLKRNNKTADCKNLL